jgi:hypothetical protein
METPTSIRRSEPEVVWGIERLEAAVDPDEMASTNTVPPGRDVGSDVGVSVGGRGVKVGGRGVLVISGVSVGGRGVNVGPAGVCVIVADDVGVGVNVGGTDVFVGVGVGGTCDTSPVSKGFGRPVP